MWRVVLQAIKNLKVGSMWAALKEQRCQKHKNAMLDVDKHVNRLRLQMLLVPSCSHDEVQAALEAQTPEDLHALHAELFKECHLEALVEGNVSRSEAIAIARCAQWHVTKQCDVGPSCPQATPDGSTCLDTGRLLLHFIFF